ncbi:SDR family oxidoreductase [Sneathiella sp. P13V-1]|uniref:SDR family oxidoreductase n=1 Tax=Sneathiella sp. P13V-1 TaxID=2697366 RepID=UPI0039EFF821|nr:SDR family oxidoreductase [Sneathiella sp. P13V-1]
MLEGKVVVVTGAGRGIGRGIAMMAASQGAKVVVNDLGGTEQGEGADQIPALEVVKSIEDAGGEAIANFGSVADPDAAGEMIEDARKNFGRIDCIVNNAGILRDRIFHKMSEEEFDLVIDVHLKGSFNVARAAAPYLKEQQSGSMVHMTSTSGLIGNFGQANYAAAKLGIAGLSRSIALDMSRFNVRSNCVSPFAWSRLIGTIPQGTDAERERVKKIQQMTPEKIAPLTVYLLSDQASAITGQIFVVRNNEICLMSQPRPIRNIQTSEGWTPETVAARFGPAVESSLVPLERSGDVFCWDPV